MLRKLTVATLSAVVVAYLGVVGVAWSMQDQLLYHPDPREIAPPADGPPIQVVYLTASDGERLVAWYLPPKGDRPVVLHLNGNGPGLSVQNWRWKRFDKAGVGFLSVAWRGFGGSSGKPSEAGLQRDAEAAYAWLAARYPPQRMVLHGYSLGSGLAVQLAGRHPARALILEAPYTSTVEVAKVRYPWLPVELLMRGRYPSIERIGKVHMPVLIVHGERDSVIPVRFGRALYNAANHPKVFVGMLGSDHNTLVRDGLYEDHVWPYLGVGVPEGEERRRTS